MTATRAGKFRQTISLQQATLAADSTGQPIETWATVYASVPMEVIESRGTPEKPEGKQTVGGTVQQWRIRWRTGIDSTWRAVWNGVNYHLLSARDPDGRRWVLVLEVTA